MEVLLIRYSEIGLKSKPIRKRFETQLRDNIMTMLVKDGVEAIVVSGDARFYVESNDLEKAAESIRRVFGVASISKTMTTTSDMSDICKAAAEYSQGRLKPGQSFAVRARREGTHTYTSMDVGREAGSAIFLSNTNVKVNLHDPDVTFFIEVRNNKAFIFGEYIPGPGGLPLGSQGRVVAIANDDRGILSAWLMMKRGCRAFVHGKADTSLLRRYDPTLKVISGAEDVNGILGKVIGISINELDFADVSGNVPVFFPTIGMNDDQVKQMLRSIN